MELESVLSQDFWELTNEEKEKIFNYLVSSKAEDFPKKYLRKVCDLAIELLKYKGRPSTSGSESESIANDRDELKSLKKRIRNLEEDRHLLKRKVKELNEENRQLQNNVSSGIGLESDKESTDPLSELDKYEDLLKNISVKNKHIKKLVRDIEVMYTVYQLQAYKL